ncbi:MAG: NUDIX hydrolase [Burkholderiaceae bacterium]
MAAAPPSHPPATAPWKPSSTVAAVVPRDDGRLLMIEEQTSEGLRLNQPAGHLDPGETLQDAAVRETLEEAAWHVEPVALLGLYMGRYRSATHGVDVTYLRHAFVCRPLRDEPGRPLDTGIVRALWMTPDEVLAAATRHRSPLVARTVLDYVAGRRFPLDLIWTHPDAIGSAVPGAGVS